MKASISIIGCGWLGLPLAKHFMKQGALVHGSTSTVDKLNTLSAEGIKPHLLKFSAEGIIGNITTCLEDCETLILNIPPGLRKHPEHDYIKMMSHIIPHIETSSIKQVLFVGSTSVYEDQKPFVIIKEDSPTSKSETAHQLLKVERLFQTNIHFNTTVLRFGGLIGEERHPAKYLAGKEHLRNPEAPVNLIHRKDCIFIIDAILKHDAWRDVFNAAYPFHPEKKAYYTSICKALNLASPGFDNTKESYGKIIDSSKLIKKLHYTFQQPI